MAAWPGTPYLIKIAGRKLTVDEAVAIGLQLQRDIGTDPVVDALVALQSDETYLFLDRDIGAAPVAGLESGPIRLAESLTIPGKSAGQAAPFHYIVETDVDADADADMNRWYDEEHMPGLASVEGNVLSRRFVDAGGSPRYYACYDLMDPSARQTEAWIAVTKTDWSSRIRPRFFNTKRTVFSRLALPRGY